MPINEALLKRLRDNDPTLTKLELSNMSLTKDDMTALAEAIDSNNQVKELDLSNNDIGDDGLQNLFDFFLKNKSLESFVFVNCGITDKGAISLSDALWACQRICPVIIDLRNNKIGAVSERRLTELPISITLYLDTNSVRATNTDTQENVRPTKSKYTCIVQ